MADYKTPQWLLPNEKNLAYPAVGAETGSVLSEDRHSLYSMNFDGTTNQNINLPTNWVTSLGLSTEMSFSVWVKPDSTSTQMNITSSPYNTWNDNFGIKYIAGSTTLTLEQGSTVKFTNTSTTLSTTSYTHICFVLDAGESFASTKVKCYINGTVVTNENTTSSFTTMVDKSYNFYIGRLYYGAGSSNYTWNGQIDEVAIWNKALNQSEINALSVADAPANIMALNEKPIAYYPLGEQAQMGSANWSFPNGSLQSHVVDFNSASSESIILSTSASFKVQAQTVSMWVKPELNTRDPLFLNGHTSVGNVGFEVYQDFGNIRVRINGSSQIIGAVNIGEWNHIFAAYDGADLKYSVNGATIATYNFAATISYSFYTGLILGNSAYGYYDGQTSNVAFWTSDQSSNYVNAYNNGSPQSTYTATPTAWWKLNAANSSYVYPWLISMTGNTDYASGNGCFTSGGVLKWIDTNSQLLSEDEYFTFTTQEVNYSGSITLSTTGGNYESSSSQLEYSLEYKVDQGSWTVWKTQVVNSGTSNTAWTATDVVVNPTSSVQVRLRATGGLFGSSQFTLNDVTIGDLYTETFAVDGIGYTNNTITQPPVDWTFIDTETPAPNYTSALNFNGSNNYIQIPYNANLTPQTGNFTISAWINTGNLSGWHPIWSTLNLSSSTSTVAIHTFNTKIRVTVGRPTSGWALLLDSTQALSTSTWYHIAVTFDFSGNAQIYINGNADNSGAIGTHSTTWDTGDRYIGEGEGFWNGRVSNLSIYSSELTSAQVQTLYNNGTPETAISFSPTSWWKLDNTTTGIQDSGSASNNGTNNGATQIATNVLISNNGESDTLPTSALTPSDLQFESPYSNYSLDFDGIGNYLNTQSTPLQLGLPATTVTASDFSLSFWYYFDATQNYDPIMQASVSATNGFGVWQSTTNTSSLNFWVGNYSSGSLYTTQLTSETWYHIGCVFKGGATHTQEIYVNGVLNNTVSYTTSRVIQSGENCLIGGQTFNSRYLSGKLDEIAVWSSALSQDQIIQVYNNGYPANIASLSPTAWWRLGEDAYFVGNDITIPNQITGGSTGTGSGTQTAILVGDAPGSYANGSGTNLVVTDRIGDAPESTANSVSINMIPSNRISYPAGYVPTQVDNAFSMAFDGVSNSKFNVNPPTIGSDNTISAWAKRVGTGNMFLLGNTSSGGYGCYFVGTSGVYVQGSGGYFAFTNSAVTTAMVRTDWVNWVFIKNSSAGTVSVYVDGELAQSASSTGGMDSLTSIGGSGLPTGSQFPWNGNIDEVAVFNYILSERQIKQDIYEGTTAGGKTADLNNISNLTAPVAWYRMGD